MSSEFKNKQYGDVKIHKITCDKELNVLKSQLALVIPYNSGNTVDIGLNCAQLDKKNNTLYFADYYNQNIKEENYFTQLHNNRILMPIPFLEISIPLPEQDLKSKYYSELFSVSKISIGKHIRDFNYLNNVRFTIRTDSIIPFGTSDSRGILYSADNDELLFGGSVYNINKEKFTMEYPGVSFGAERIDDTFYFLSDVDFKKIDLISYKKGKEDVLFSGYSYIKLLDDWLYYSLPLEASPNKRYLAFFASEQIGTEDLDYLVNLIVYDLETKNTVKCISWEGGSCFDEQHNLPAIIKWKPSNTQNLLAIYYNSKNHSIGQIIIYDYDKKEVISRIENLPFDKKPYIKSICWVPDENKICFLTYVSGIKNGYYYDNTKLKARLYIYDLDTKKLTKLMDCPDCFDFHFVE